VERLANRAGRGKDKELQKISRHLAEDTVPGDKGGPIMDLPLYREPVDVPHMLKTLQGQMEG